MSSCTKLSVRIAAIVAIFIPVFHTINNSDSYGWIGLRDSQEYTNTPIVSTDYGKLAGYKSQSRDGRDFFGFVGIPYAKAPVGNLRFQVSKLAVNKFF